MPGTTPSQQNNATRRKPTARLRRGSKPAP